MTSFSYLSNADTNAFDELYQQYQNDPKSVDNDWRCFFEGFDFSGTSYTKAASVSLDNDSDSVTKFKKEVSVLNLIGAYRQRGHLLSKTNPLRARRKLTEPLELDSFNLGDSDLDTVFQAGRRIGSHPCTLRQIIDHLEKTYCRSIGVEYTFVRMRSIIQWLESRMEDCCNTPNFSIDEKQHIFEKLNQAVSFENFLHTKFVGQKRFSLEGAESIIPALDTLVELGAELGVKEFVIGMAHRGRLNVLVNILNKSYESVFTEFEGKTFKGTGFEGDVKYHMGFSLDKFTKTGKKVHLNLPPNPSHLEAVDPVVAGISRAKIENRYAGDEKKLVPILIHGDASVAGQGIIYEVLQMSLLEGYRTGGTVHVILNNQVGFTTNYLDARSSTYSTDIAKTTLSPVFHVNGDDVESVAYIMQLALKFRQEFHRDVFVDIVCYRKHGHNEGDEPSFTQPILYEIIAKHPNPVEVYTKYLLAEGSLSREKIQSIQNEFKTFLDSQLLDSKKQDSTKEMSFLRGAWQGIRLPETDELSKAVITGIDKTKFLELAERMTDLPQDLPFFQKIRRIYKGRHKMVFERDKLDWGMAENMAYASLVDEKTPIRLSGEDVGRGTFSHRHSVITLKNDKKYIPLNNLSEEQAPFMIYNSLLSEYGVLGFDYGYALATPNTLTIWEAQFGDFANGAQIIIDQFIVSAETKWQRMSGLVMLLPHGYEGQGPEHSSARVERYLSLCARNNMQVVNCTTPANLFHVLRRQIHRDFRKPLIVFTPKSLLRHPKCVSSIEEFTGDSLFHEMIDDSYAVAEKVSRVLFCTGKIYYNLLEYQQEHQRENVAIVRVEQMYPLPENQLRAVIQKYSHAEHWTWVQEEPENMGAWGFMLRKFRFCPKPLEVISRIENSSPSTGFAKQHATNQKLIVEQAFGDK